MNNKMLTDLYEIIKYYISIYGATDLDRIISCLLDDNRIVIEQNELVEILNDYLKIGTSLTISINHETN